MTEEQNAAGDDADPHADQPVVTAGAPASAAEAVVVLLHGRGASAQGIVNLAEPLYRHGVTFVAPQAARSRWFPYDSSGPVERNEPHVSSALAAVDRVLIDVREWGVPLERVVLFGFSQGASLACEYATRNPREFGGVVALSGGLLGPVGPTWEHDEATDGALEATLDGTPVFLGVGGSDDEVVVERVHETASVFRALDGDVTERVYDGLGHAVIDDEFEFTVALLDDVLDAGAE